MLKIITNEIIQKCFNWHEEFGQRIWHGRDSFHNADHIRSTMTAGEKLVVAALSGNDPLEIMDDLKKWNEQHPDAQINQEELPEVIRLAFAPHDLGNIAEKAEILPDGKIVIIFLDKYKAAGAENRSIQIAEKVIEASGMPEEQIRRFLSLVKHLINETKFIVVKEVPFAKFMRVVDQIGNDLFSNNEKRAIGLLEEICAENPGAKFSPYFFFNFTRESFPQLVPDENTRSSILEIWKKELPEEKVGLMREPTSAKEWLAKFSVP